VARRLAFAFVALLALLPSLWRALAPREIPSRGCEPEGRGIPPRHWIGCRADPGPPRALTGRELLLLGRPVDLNAAGPDDLAAVPGLSPRLAAEIVADRQRRGPFPSVEALLRVRGVGPARLAKARAALEIRASQ
jgi:competence protein ComEA